MENQVQVILTFDTFDYIKLEIKFRISGIVRSKK